MVTQPHAGPPRQPSSSPLWRGAATPHGLRPSIRRLCSRSSPLPGSYPIRPPPLLQRWAHAVAHSPFYFFRVDRDGPTITRCLGRTLTQASFPVSPLGVVGVALTDWPQLASPSSPAAMQQTSPVCSTERAEYPSLPAFAARTPSRGEPSARREVSEPLISALAQPVFLVRLRAASVSRVSPRSLALNMRTMRDTIFEVERITSVIRRGQILGRAG